MFLDREEIGLGQARVVEEEDVEQRSDWDLPFPHGENAGNNVVGAAYGLAPNEVHQWAAFLAS